MMPYSVRRAVVSDAGIIATHRAKMFYDMGELTDAQYARLHAVTVPWIAERVATGAYVGWLVEYESHVVAGGGVVLRDLWPTPRNYHAGRIAHVGSMYTEPEHRRRGIARLVMQAILGWCGDNAIDLVTLTASKAGRPLYAQFGFTPDAKAMRLDVTR
jgi:GNAT superfamily N-acetyltransferase